MATTILADIITLDNNEQNSTQTKLDDMFDAIEDKLKSDGKYRLWFRGEIHFVFITRFLLIATQY